MRLGKLIIQYPYLKRVILISGISVSINAVSKKWKYISELITHLNNTIMGKGQDSKKSVKKEATKSPKEKKAEKRLKKALKK